MTNHTSHPFSAFLCSCESSSCQTRQWVQAALTHAYAHACLREEEKVYLKNRHLYETVVREYSLYHRQWRNHAPGMGDGLFEASEGNIQQETFCVSPQQYRVWRQQRYAQLNQQQEKIRTQILREKEAFEQASVQYTYTFRETCTSSLLWVLQERVSALKDQSSALEAAYIKSLLQQSLLYERYIASGRSLSMRTVQEGVDSVFWLYQEHALGYRLHDWDLTAQSTSKHAHLAALTAHVGHLDACLATWSRFPEIVMTTQPRAAILHALLL